MRISHKSARGFTFLEIMLVVVIIGILAATVGVRLVGRTNKARIAAAKTQIENFKTGLTLYEAAVGSYPTSSQGLKALTEKPSDVQENDWDGPYLSGSVPKDPWGKEYIYKSPGEHTKDFDLYSSGPDGTPDNDDDIKNWSDDKEKF